MIPRSDGTKKKSPKYEDKEEQDRDVGKNKGTQPKKYYKGLDKETKQKRDAHFKQGKTDFCNWTKMMRVNLSRLRSLSILRSFKKCLVKN